MTRLIRVVPDKNASTLKGNAAVIAAQEHADLAEGLIAAVEFVQSLEFNPLEASGDRTGCLIAVVRCDVKRRPAMKRVVPGFF